MEKALDILNNIYFDDRGVMCIEKSTALDVFNAIAELEEAIKPKTCKGCVYEAEDIQDLHCAFCSRACKDNFESKDNA